MNAHAVVVAGGGPTGLMLAGELALAGIDVVIVERRTSQDVDGSRAGGLHSRTLEVLDQRGIADRFLAEGEAMQVQGFAGIPLDISDFPTRRNHGLALWQSHIERILATWVGELGVPILRGREVVGFTQDATGVDVQLSGDTSLRAAYLVGCDGGRSLVRKTAGIDFPGLAPSTSWMIAEVEMTAAPEIGMRREGGGIGPVDRAAGGGPYRVVLKEPPDEHAGEPTLQQLREALIGAYGTHYGAHSPTWISRFTDASRQAASYRRGRVLLAGDAAHVHPPQGGQGLNTGLQDAVNLGWKLAQVVDGTSPERLLDTYHAERHPVGARVLHNTMAQVALSSADDRHQALRETVTGLLAMDEPRRRIAGMLSGLDIHYDLGDGHPLLGRRIPDLDIESADGPTRVFALLHDARPVLLDLGGHGRPDLTAWADQVRIVDAEHVGTWELPVIGEVTAPAAVLIRPDGYVAWVGETTDPSLPDALLSWFGAPAGGPPAARQEVARRQADGLERALTALGKEERAEKERSYLRSSLRHLGVSVPAVRATATRFHREHPALGHDEVVAVVAALWDVPVHERRLAAIELLVLRADVLTPADLPLLDRLVRESGTWALLDGLAANVVGGLRERYPDELEATLEGWSTDPDRWVRRASLLAHLVALRGGREDLADFGRRADRLLEDRDPFVRKAIGWVLRDTGRRRPGLVVAWLEPRRERISRPTLREAVRSLPDEDRERLLRTADRAR